MYKFNSFGPREISLWQDKQSNSLEKNIVVSLTKLRKKNEDRKFIRCVLKTFHLINLILFVFGYSSCYWPA